MNFEIIADVITGERTMFAKRDGILHEIAKVPRTKWKAANGMNAAIAAICQKHTDWALIRSECQAMIDAAPSVSPGDISAQVFDPLKLMRDGSPMGDLLKRAASGDRSAMRAFPRVVAREEMIRTFGNHIVRLTSVTGEGLGSGILIVLPARGWGIMTCSHVWTQLIKHERVQMYCACKGSSISLDQKMIEVPVDDLCTLDMADRDFMEQAGVDVLLFKRDSAIIAGNLQGLLPKSARAFDLRAVSNFEPESENYALVGYPLAAKGELGSLLLDYAGKGRNSHVFLRHKNDEGAGSLNGASGGLVVAVRSGNYRPVGLMVEEQGSVEEASVDSCERCNNPSAFHALPLVDLRTMVQKAGTLPFRHRNGRIVLEFRRG